MCINFQMNIHDCKKQLAEKANCPLQGYFMTSNLQSKYETNISPATPAGFSANLCSYFPRSFILQTSRVGTKPFIAKGRCSQGSKKKLMEVKQTRR